MSILRHMVSTTGFLLILSLTSSAPHAGEAGRVPWTNSRITGSPEPPAPYRIERVFPNVKFDHPVEMTAAPGSERLFVLENKGKIYSLAKGEKETERELCFDLKAAVPEMEQAYGLTFHPKFAENRYCYIGYVLKAKLPQGTRISRFTVTETNPPQIDPASEQIVITWLSGGHNGACLKFGPEGFLYISSGDGGPSFPTDPLKTGQDISDLLASVMRIDVDHPSGNLPYSIPADNPYVNHDGARGEVWAYGFRNPWKMSFDPADGSLWVGDVGWELWEMIYRVEKGGNYGWSLMEASQPVHTERPRGPSPILPPTVAHSHIESRSITGGYVYRGSRLPELVGAYIYGDYVTGKVWAVRHDGKRAGKPRELVDTPIQIVTFGVDHAGELYVVGYDGTVHRLVPNPVTAANSEFPVKLSDTGLFADIKGHKPSAGVLPYEINASAWADHATAEFLLGLPGDSRLDVYTGTNTQIGYIAGHWKFPTDGVLVKTISLEMKTGDPTSQQRIETQILHFNGDMWHGYSYLWNDEQTDAFLAPVTGANRTLTVSDPAAPEGKRVQNWHIPSRSECLLCHTTRSGSLAAFHSNQLNRDVGGKNQLDALASAGVFVHALPEKRDTIVSPHDAGADITQRARAYLHINCAHCHRRGGGGTAAFDVRHENPLEKAKLLGERPTQGTFDIHGAQVVAAGDPYRSVLYYRMAKLGRGHMPQFGATQIDAKGVELMHDWIAQLPVAKGGHGGSANLRTAQTTALKQLRANDRAQDASVVAQLLATPSGAMRLLKAVDARSIDKAAVKLAIEQGAAHPNPAISGLFERFIPAERRVVRLGTVIKPEAILALSGDITRGRALFAKGVGVQCRNCHQIGGQGKAFGPDLSQIGKKYPRPKLLESILHPSRDIDPKFVAYLVETKGGKVYTGLLVEKGTEKVVLKDHQLQTISIATDEIELMAPQQKSLMPELLLQEMTAAQVADLLAYLESLKE